MGVAANPEFPPRLILAGRLMVAALLPQSPANQTRGNCPPWSLPSRSLPRPLAQSARVVDGDTLKVDGVTYRLWGIVSPESAQPCADGWPAGRAATEHLRALIGERHVTCEPRTLNRYGRTVAVCHVDGRDLGADMVTDGHAWAFVRYSRDTTSKKNAKRQRFGPAYMDAWQWRGERR